MKNRTHSSSLDLDGVPAAFAQKLADLITAEDDRKIVQTLREALNATLVTRVPRGPENRNDYAEGPDWRVRVLAAKVMAEMKHGRPQQSVSLTVSEAKKPMTRLEAARELLENWEDVRRIGDAHVKLLREAMPEIVDVEAAEP